MSIQETIRSQLAQDRVVLYMKGTPDFPQCGFSGRATQLLKQVGIEFKAYNVLEDAELRQGIKEYGQWPTIPQLYVDGQLIGGCDIIVELAQKGELQKLNDTVNSIS
ncbi:MAG TPA: Grx4 family monothiol glutaredoxin [Coxiellaceae bacterium]|nr:Grx4 family monothiol glutaredoxin [Coxiellaceae bacterium]